MLGPVPGRVLGGGEGKKGRNKLGVQKCLCHSDPSSQAQRVAGTLSQQGGDQLGEREAQG